MTTPVHGTETEVFIYVADDVGQEVIDQITALVSGHDPDGSLNEIKQNKINELNGMCNQTILSGFKSSVLGVEHTYGFDYEDQTNFAQKVIELLLDNTVLEIYWKTEDAGVLVHTREQFIALSQDIKIHKEGNIQKYWGLKQQVNNATTKEEVELIQW